MRGIAVLIALAGCNRVFGLDSTDLAIDSSLADMDRDSIPDESDNCVAIPNQSQLDEDRDTVGDACDNCPMIRNPNQDTDGDADRVGDHCDPHPTIDGDCLVLFDTFNQPTSFAQHWISHPAAGETFETQLHDGYVVVTSSPVRVVLEVEAPLSGLFDVQLAGKARLPFGHTVAVLSNNNSHDTGYDCGTQGSGTSANSFIYQKDANTLPVTNVSSMSSVPIADDFVLRLGTTNALGVTRLTCRVDHGIAIGFQPELNPFAMPVGRPAFAVQSLAVEVHAFAAYAFKPGTSGTSCPEPILR